MKDIGDMPKFRNTVLDSYEHLWVQLRLYFSTLKNNRATFVYTELMGTHDKSKLIVGFS